MAEATFYDQEFSIWRFIRYSKRLRLIVCAVFLLILALGFNALLSLSSLERLYIESMVSKYRVIARDLQRNIQKGLKFGKNIDKFVGIDKLLVETKENLVRRIVLPERSMEAEAIPVLSSDITISVSMLNGKTIYSTDPKTIGVKYSGSILSMIQNGDEPGKTASEIDYVKKDDSYYFTVSIVAGFKKKHAASIVISFSENQVKRMMRLVLIKNAKKIAVIVIVGTILLAVILLLLTTIVDGTRRYPKAKISFAMFIVVFFSQLVFTGLNAWDFRDYYLKISKEKTAVLATLLKEDIEFLLNKGLKINKLIKMDVMLGEIIAAAPELDNIVISDNMGTPLYLASKEGILTFGKESDDNKEKSPEKSENDDSDYVYQLKIQRAGNIEGEIAVRSFQGIIRTRISKKILFDKLKEIGLDSLTVLVISSLFLVELLIMVFQFIRGNITDPGRTYKVHYISIRPAAFLFLFGIDICISFVPLHMEKLYLPMFGLSKDMVMSLPISAEMLFAGIFGIVAGTWIDRRGWGKPFFIGLLLSCLGSVYSWISPNAYHFILSRCLTGAGYGIAWMATQGFIISASSPDKRAQGLAQLFAGMLAGSICGGATGAMVAERIGYAPVFLLGAIIVLITGIYCVFFMKNALGMKNETKVERKDESISFREVFRFLFNKNISALIILSIFPASIAVVGFLNYFSPVYLNRIGASQSNIGRIYMIFGLCLIYIAPFVSKYIDASENKNRYILIHGLLAGLSFVIFFFFEGIAATALAVLLIGVAFSFDASRAFALKMDITNELGEGKALGVLSTVEKIGQVIGPILFGWLIIRPNLRGAVSLFGVVIIITSVLFLLLTRKQHSVKPG